MAYVNEPDWSGIATIRSGATPSCVGGRGCSARLLSALLSIGEHVSKLMDACCPVRTAR